MHGGRRSSGHALDDRLLFADSGATYNEIPHFPADYCDYCNCSIPKKSQDDRMWIADDMAPSMPSESMPEEGDRAEDFSGTNNQVDGVDEADTVKNDGQYIYMLPKAYGVSQACSVLLCGE